jgi:predicted nuclease of predicted toxin-antitoxin system
MRVKLDENLPAVLTDVFAAFGHEADTAPQEGLTGRPDDEIWNAAMSSERFLCTQDLDFSDARKFVPGTHPGLLIIRLGNPSRRALLERIRQILQTEDVESWKGALVIATESRIRVRRA